MIRPGETMVLHPDLVAGLRSEPLDHRPRIFGVPVRLSEWVPRHMIGYEHIGPDGLPALRFETLSAPAPPQIVDQRTGGDTEEEG